MEGYKELLDKLNGLVHSLENGELSLDELNELEAVTRTLHERSIILRYKAFESSVLGKEETTDTEEVPAEDVESEEETTSDAPAEALAVSDGSQETEAESDPEPEEEPAFDFAIFDQEETPTEEEETSEPEPEPIAETPEPVVEPEPVPEPTQAPEPVVETVEATVETPEVEAEPEVEEDEEPASVPPPVPAASTGNSFLDRFAQQDNSVAGRFSAGPLDSLIGAFGLNERLRFINDLFDGSSEKFSDAIKALDAQSDLDSAKAKAAGYAEENEWDPEEEVVAEFMNYLNRRYA